MKSLLYLASGNQIKKEYYSLPFDLICLVDYSFLQPVKKKGKFLLLGMDVIDAIKYLKSENLKFDCLVILNEGLREGGGRYSPHTDLVLGYLMPILKDTYIHIMCPWYYNGSWWARNKTNIKLDLPYEKFELSPQYKDYIDPKIFSNIHGTKVFRMKKINAKKRFV